MSGRSSQIHAFSYQMSKLYECGIEAEYQDDRRYWVLHWHDGPTEDTIRSAVKRHLPGYQDIIRTSRMFSDEAVVLGVIRLYASGEGPKYVKYGLDWHGQKLLEDVADPMRAATARETAMVTRLLEESAQVTEWGRYKDYHQALKLLTDRGGIGWLLTPADQVRQPVADNSAQAVLEPSPIELLTARYARGEQGAAWRSSAEPMPAREAFTAALADEEIDRSSALAALGLVAGLRAELDTQEAEIIARARSQGASWTDVGRVLGMAKQSAAKRYGVLAKRPSGEPSANG